VLERRGLAEETVVVFTSDHGDMMGSRETLGKHEPYDPSARTPLTVRWPGRVPAGRTLTGPVESIDLPCSLLAAAGLTAPPAELLPASPGRSWWSYVRGRAGPPRAWAFSEMGTWRMACDEAWKFVHRSDGEDELYDRNADPHERRNLAADPARRDEVRRLQRCIIESLGETVAPPAEDMRRVRPDELPPA
jgi:arylsulfatase A-like enzyme